MKRATIAALAVIITCGPRYVAAQSLADVARAEEARRKTVEQTTAGKAAKVYTNDNLKADMTAPTTPVTPDGLLPPAAPGAKADDKPAADTSLHDEKYWSGRLADARAAVERNKMFADALQSRINALRTDFVNRDDPAQRSVIEQDRIKAMDELKKVQKDIDDGAKAIAAIQDEGRRAGAPAGWLR